MSAPPTMPFVQMRVDILDVLPRLKGCLAQVYLAVGAFESDPIAPCLRDVMDFTHLSKPSVSTALRILAKEELICCVADEQGLERFRSSGHFQYKAEPVSVRVNGWNADREKSFFAPSSSNSSSLCTAVSIELEEEETTTINDAKTFLAAAGVMGRALGELAATVDAAVAREWSEWVERMCETKPDYGWGGVVVNSLRADPAAHPPYVKRDEPRKRQPYFSGKLFEQMEAERRKSE